MSELTEVPSKFTSLQQELLRFCSRNITEDDLLSIRGLIDHFLFSRSPKFAPELIEEFGSTRDDFDEWRHDPGK